MISAVFATFTAEPDEKNENDRNDHRHERKTIFHVPREMCGDAVCETRTARVCSCMCRAVQCAYECNDGGSCAKIDTWFSWYLADGFVVVDAAVVVLFVVAAVI